MSFAHTLLARLANHRLRAHGFTLKQKRRRKKRK